MSYRFSSSVSLVAALWLGGMGIAQALPNRVVQGQVELRRTGWSNFRVVGVGTELFHGDLLRAIGSNTAISCGDALPLSLTPNTLLGVSNLCRNAARELSALGIRGNTNQSLLDETYGELSDLAQTAPEMLLLTPRHSWILSTTPQFQWQDRQTSPATYTLTVSRLGKKIWQGTTTEKKIAYGGASPLQPGVEYSVTLERAGAKDDTYFSVLASGDREAVQDKAKAIANSSMDPLAKTLSQVDLYIQNELYNEAIATLNQTLTQSPKAAILYRSLGQVYSYVILPDQAKQAYLQALTMVPADQAEARAPIAKELAQLYWAMDEKQEGRKFFQQALSLYTALGDTKQMAEIEGYLEQASPQP